MGKVFPRRKWGESHEHAVILKNAPLALRHGGNPLQQRLLPQRSLAYIELVHVAVEHQPVELVCRLRRPGFDLVHVRFVTVEAQP